MKPLVLFLLFALSLQASTYEQLIINLKAHFYIEKNNKQSKLKTFEYSFSIYHDSVKEFYQAGYCFFSETKVQFSDNIDKSKYRMCLRDDGTSYIYTLSKSYRYTAAKDYAIRLESIDIDIDNRTSNRNCKSVVTDYQEINDKINECLTPLNTY